MAGDAVRAPAGAAPTRAGMTSAPAPVVLRPYRKPYRGIRRRRQAT
jgi:hypothetical protein